MLRVAVLVLAHRAKLAKIGIFELQNLEKNERTERRRRPKQGKMFAHYNRLAVSKPVIAGSRSYQLSLLVFYEQIF